MATFHLQELRAFGDIVSSDNMYVYTDDFVGVDGQQSIDDTNGGNDTINTSPIQDPVVVDLTAGPAGRSIIKGQPVNIVGVVENAFTGDGEDTLIGNAVDNVLKAGRGYVTFRQYFFFSFFLSLYFDCFD